MSGTHVVCGSKNPVSAGRGIQQARFTCWTLRADYGDDRGMSGAYDADQRVAVLVVGGSLSGLAAGLFLAWYGVDALVVERHREPPSTRAPDW